MSERIDGARSMRSFFSFDSGPYRRVKASRRIQTVRIHKAAEEHAGEQIKALTKVF